MGLGEPSNAVSSDGDGCVPQVGGVSYAPWGSALPRALLVFEGIYRKRWGEKLVKPVNMAKPLQVDLKYRL